MSSIGDVTKVFNAQNVQLSINGSNMITLFNMSKIKAHPRSRTATRSGAVDYYSWPLISVTAEALVSKDVYDSFNTAATLSSRGQLPQTNFVVTGQNIDGNIADDISATFTAQVPELSDIANETGGYIIRFTLIILNSSYVTS